MNVNSSAPKGPVFGGEGWFVDVYNPGLGPSRKAYASAAST